MTNRLSYRPDHAPQGFESTERLVFVDPADQHGREFEIQPHHHVAGADSPEINQAVEDAYDQVQQDREEAAARQAEQDATPEDLRLAIQYNTQAMAAMQDYAEIHGIN